MVVKTDNTLHFLTSGRSPITFVKIAKRWYVEFRVKSEEVKKLIPVKHVLEIKGGRKI